MNKVEANPPAPSSSPLPPNARRQPITGHASLLAPLALAPPSRKQHFANQDGCVQAEGAARGRRSATVKFKVLGKNRPDICEWTGNVIEVTQLLEYWQIKLQRLR